MAIGRHPLLGGRALTEDLIERWNTLYHQVDEVRRKGFHLVTSAAVPMLGEHADELVRRLYELQKRVEMLEESHKAEDGYVAEMTAGGDS